jgi:hypothetical protein
LVGHATVVRTRVYGEKGVAAKQKDQLELVQKLRSQSYDSVSFVDEKGYDNIVVWEPFPIIALCRLELSKVTLANLANQVKDLQDLQLEPFKIAYRLPEGKITASMPIPDDSLVSFGTTTQMESIVPIINFTKAPLQGLQIQKKWSGGIESGGMAETVELDLMDKMKFLNNDASPFKGLERLRSLLKENVSTPILHLLFSAELIQYKDFPSAEKSFDEYLAHLRAEPGSGLLLHPWALVVCARLYKETSQECIAVYLKLFASYEEVLSPSELEMSTIGEATVTHDEPSAEDTLNHRWTNLKLANPDQVESDAMEKLLGLTGLLKVKIKAISLWESSLQLQRISDPDVRRDNQPAANYCFVGNPGEYPLRFESQVSFHY